MYTTGTGNVILDMEQQLQANSIRIKVLEQENMTLHKSLATLRRRSTECNVPRVRMCTRHMSCSGLYKHSVGWAVHTVVF